MDILVATGCHEDGGMPVEATGTIVKTALMGDEVSITVLAAGGIVNEAMAKASACVGAEGAYAVTRFVMSNECRAAQATKEDILNTEADDLDRADGGGRLSQVALQTAQGGQGSCHREPEGQSQALYRQLIRGYAQGRHGGGHQYLVQRCQPDQEHRFL